MSPGSASKIKGAPQRFDAERRVVLKARTGFDYRSLIAQTEQDIEAIEAGLETLSRPVGR